MTIALIGSATYLTANPTITIPSGCTNVLCIQVSYGSISINSLPMTELVRTGYYQSSLWELVDPPIGTFATSTSGDTIRTFIYLSDAGSGVGNTYTNYSTTGYVSLTFNTLITELIIYGGFGSGGFTMGVDGGGANYINPNYSAYIPGTGNSMTVWMNAPDSGEPLYTPGKVALLACRFPTASSMLPTQTYMCMF
jgi:hypothetical protein